MNKLAGSARNLDQFDLKILNVIQTDNRLSHADIGRQVGLSTSAIRRRIRTMTDNGTIIANIALVEPELFGVTLIMELAFLTETPESYRDFDALIAESLYIQQGYHVAGDIDYVLIVHGPSLRWYEEWVSEYFTSDRNIKRVSTRVVWSRRKFDPSISVTQPFV